MDNLSLLLIIILGIVIFKYSENFNTTLNAFDNNWGDFDSSNLNSKPTKTSGLIAGCDEKRGTCITY